MPLFGRKTRTTTGRARGNAALSASFSLPFELIDGKAPSEFRIFKAGDNPSTKGMFLFDELSQKLVMEKYAARGNPMMMDYEHQSAAEPPVEAPASAKSFVPQVRDGELWATEVVWTDRARAYLESGEYRLFSPWFSYEEQPDGRLRVTRLINVALTNNPALDNLEPLMAASDKDDEDMEEELRLLKAQLKAMEEKCSGLAAANAALTAKLSGYESKDEEMRATAALRDEVHSITGKEGKEAVGVLRSIALKAKGADEAQAKLREIEATGRDTEFSALLDAGFKEGKISRDQRASFWEKKCRGEDKHVTVEGLAMLKDFLPTAPVQITLRESAQKDGKGGLFSSTEKTILARMGITDADQLKNFDAFRAAQET